LSRIPLAAALALAVAAAGTADAVIVPQKSIRGVSIGNTVRAVHAKLGKPDAVAYQKNEILSKIRSERYGRTIVRYDGTDLSSRVILVTTTSPKERVNGVGIGSTPAQVAAKVPKVKCEFDAGVGYCHVGEATPGARVTDFNFTNGRVSAISVGLIVD
jgi:hypothetical protein